MTSQLNFILYTIIICFIITGGMLYLYKKIYKYDVKQLKKLNYKFTGILVKPEYFKKLNKKIIKRGIIIWFIFFIAMIIYLIIKY